MQRQIQDSAHRQTHTQWDPRGATGLAARFSPGWRGLDRRSCPREGDWNICRAIRVPDSVPEEEIQDWNFQSTHADVDTEEEIQVPIHLFLLFLRTIQ